MFDILLIFVEISDVENDDDDDDDDDDDVAILFKVYSL